MKKKLSIVLMASLFLMVCCKTPIHDVKPNPVVGDSVGGSDADNPEDGSDNNTPLLNSGMFMARTTLPAIDNSRYELKTKRLSVQGIGMSRDMQESRSEARDAVKSEVVTTLSALVGTIAQERGLKKPDNDIFRFTGTKTVKDGLETVTDDRGGKRYRFTLVQSMDVESALKDVFEKMDAPTNYSWYMFLRDVDYHLSSVK